MTRREHRALHRELKREHREAHRDLRDQHEGYHDQDYYTPRYNDYYSRGYYGGRSYRGWDD
jgi:hypothetical protein